MRVLLRWLALVVLSAGAVGGARGQIFTDWTSVNGSNTIAFGTLGSTTVTLTTASPGDLIASTLDGSFTGFANAAYYTPALGTTDMIEFAGYTAAPSYTITFGAPVLNPILQFTSLASTLTFGSGTPTFISGDGGLSASGNQVIGSDVAGPGPNNDANGTIQFSGLFSSLTFTAYLSTVGTDGIHLQVGATAIPEPAVSTATLGAVVLGIFLACRRRRETGRGQSSPARSA